MIKMRTVCGTIHIVALAAFIVGAAAGWGAAGHGGSVNVKMWKCANMKTANDSRAGAPNGRAQSPRASNGRVCRFATAADRESKVSEAELAALRDKMASLKNELGELLAAKGEKSEADMRAKDGDSPI